ncbi:MAG: zinc ABC transporter substrate-binding protein [Deltaproteobacteria bacterium]|nr:zinc ABC transporter substrate-binding protein [Deltaproteobacteria bacterium]
MIPTEEKSAAKGFGQEIGISACFFFIILWNLPLYADPVRVFVSITPQKYFVEKVGGNLVRVSILVPKGADPHTYEPKPQQMIELSKTDLYFAIGIDFEKAWLTKIAATNPKMHIVHTESGISKIPMASHLDAHTGGHEQTPKMHHHRQDALDPHIWLSPPLVKIQANYIMNALAAVDPKNEERYQALYFNFLKELDVLDNELKVWFEDCKGMPLIVFHPSWGYFARAYGLKQMPIQMEGKAPKPAQIRDLIGFARKNDVKVIFAQPQISAKIVETMAREIGGRVVLVDPLALDWADNLRDVARKFKEVVTVNK